MLLSEVSKLKGRYKIPLPNKGADPKRWDYDLKGAGGTQKVERQLAYIKLEVRRFASDLFSYQFPAISYTYTLAE